MAQASVAVRYAPDTLGKAWNLLSQAYAALFNHAGMTAIVTLARQAAQTAEDARTIANRRSRDEELSQARQQATRAEALRAQAEAAAQTAQTQADAARALLEQERAARQQSQAQAAAAA